MATPSMERGFLGMGLMAETAYDTAPPSNNRLATVFLEILIGDGIAFALAFPENVDDPPASILV